jgi:hypothetical protein
VLNNWRRHREDRTPDTRSWRIDPFATGWAFDGLTEALSRGGAAVEPRGRARGASNPFTAAARGARPSRERA